MSKSICLDAEFTDNTEMLELSVYDTGTATEVYHSYFRPVSATRWPISQRIHHITPAMVKGAPTFARARRDIQALIDHAADIVGFAVGNDISALENQGIQRLEDKRIIDVRDLYWFVHGRHNGGDLNNAPSLLTVAAELGVEFSDSEAHSAGADTLATVMCYRKLLEMYARGAEIDSGLVDTMLGEFDLARAEYVRVNAAGYVGLVTTPDGCFRLKVLKNNPPAGTNVLCTIAVADRNIAQYELLKRFSKHARPGNYDVFRLTDADIEFFKQYTNAHDPQQSALCRKLVAGRAHLRF